MASKPKRKMKYPPGSALQNPLEYVLSGFKPLTAHESYLVDLKLKNHGAMTALLRGSATKADIDTLIAMHNIQEAIRRMLVQKVIRDLPIELDSSTLIRGKAALLEVSARGAKTNHFVCRAPEIQALNDLMQMHDELMDIINVSHLDKAIYFAKAEITSKRATVISEYIPQGLSKETV